MKKNRSRLIKRYMRSWQTQLAFIKELNLIETQVKSIQYKNTLRAYFVQICEEMDRKHRHEHALSIIESKRKGNILLNSLCAWMEFMDVVYDLRSTLSTLSLLFNQRSASQR
jgi:hypothetical protein